MDVDAALEAVIQLAAHNLAINARTRRGKLRGTEKVKQNAQQNEAEIVEMLREQNWQRQGGRRSTVQTWERKHTPSGPSAG